MARHPVKEHMSSNDISRKKAKEVASFLTSCDLGMEPGLLILMSLHINHLNLFTEISPMVKGCTNNFLEDEDFEITKKCSMAATGHRG